MNGSIWIRKEISTLQKVLLGTLCILGVLAIWFIFTSADTPQNRLVARTVLPNPLEVLGAFPLLFNGGNGQFDWERSLFFATWSSLSRELFAFFIVVFIAIPLGIWMSANRKFRAFGYPLVVIGTFIPIAALIPLTQAIFGIDELQKIVFLSLGMFFVLVGLVIKEMDEVDDILLQTAYTLGFGQLKTLFLVNFPAALPRIWKHLSSVFGLGWGYIIFAELVNMSSGTSVSGIGWLFATRQRRGEVADMYAIFFTIIFLAFFFSYLFKISGRNFFRYEKE